MEERLMTNNLGLMFFCVRLKALPVLQGLLHLLREETSVRRVIIVPPAALSHKQSPASCGQQRKVKKTRELSCNKFCRYLKKLTCKGTLRHIFYLSEDSSPPKWAISGSVCVSDEGSCKETDAEGGHVIVFV